MKLLFSLSYSVAVKRSLFASRIHCVYLDFVGRKVDYWRGGVNEEQGMKNGGLSLRPKAVRV